MLLRRSLLGACFALALVACGGPSHGTDANRDLHGPSDVERYIASLASEARILDLDPPTVLAKLALAPGAVVADVGCGPGVFATRFARAVPQGVVYAVDVEPQQLDALRDELLRQGVENVVPVLASYSTPHLPPASCDVVFLADTYHHIEDRVAYMTRLASVLRPGGRLAILEYKPGPLPVGPPPEHKLAAGVMDKELADAGWTKSQSFDTHAHHTFEIWVR
jgi:SAM-dependent methyltransferase